MMQQVGSAPSDLDCTIAYQTIVATQTSDIAFFVSCRAEGSCMMRVIAVIDDDHAVRESLRLLLEVAGHVVETFESADEFLRAEISDLACLILDHYMPHMTGLRLAKRLRATGSVVPILLITGRPSPALGGRAAHMGIRILGKPFSEDDLLDFVNSA
jgi:two-component system, LuxR family, response regulator FixJ